MHSRRRSRCLAGVSSLLILLASETILAQRQLSWNALDVTARLGDDGVLDVTELQTMIFTGDWNGGERTFNLRARQDLDFVGMERIGPAGQSVPLILDGSLDDVDDYAFTDGRTLRWRSRLPSDPAFSGTHIRYALHYRLSGILLKEDDRYVLDHDFAFPDRAGSITSFSLRLTLDGGWQPLSELRDRYTAGPLAPGRSFVLTIPLRFTGSGSPTATDTRRPREIVAATAAILGTFVLLAAGLLIREYSLGRFKPVQSHGVDAGWIRTHIVAHPAELIGAAWDQDVDKDEVGAVIARLVGEAKLAGSVSPGSAGTSLSLELKVDRSSLQGYERTLVDGLFFDGRTRYEHGRDQEALREPGIRSGKDHRTRAERASQGFPAQGEQSERLVVAEPAAVAHWRRVSRRGGNLDGRSGFIALRRRQHRIGRRRHRPGPGSRRTPADRLGNQSVPVVDVVAPSGRRKCGRVPVVLGGLGDSRVDRVDDWRRDGVHALGRANGAQRAEVAQSPRGHRLSKDARGRPGVLPAGARQAAPGPQR